MSKINDSAFHMWRTLFAISHVDGVVSNEEIRFMVEAIEDVPFTDAQKKTLNDDIKKPQDPVAMFGHITDVRDQAKFFQFARDIVHVDGDFGTDEQQLLLKLKKIHLQHADVDKLIGSVSLELAEDIPAPAKNMPQKKGRKRDIIFSFRKRFLEGL